MAFSAHPLWRRTAPLCPMAGGVNVAHWAEVVPVRVLPVKLLFFPLQVISMCQH